MNERFPGIDWYCDRCRAKLNNQVGFNDHKYIWKCTNCGYKTSISRTNIIYTSDPSLGVTILGKTLGILNSVVIYALLLHICNIYIFQASVSLSWLNLPIICSTYLLLFIFSMFFERKIAKYCTEMKLFPYIVSSIFVYLWGNIIRPVVEPIKMIRTIISYLFSNKKWQYSLKQTIILGIAYTLILLTVILSVVWLVQNGTSNFRVKMYT